LGDPFSDPRSPVASPILRDTIKKLKDRQALLQRQIKDPLKELAQIEQDLIALGAKPGRGARAAAPAKGASGSRPAARAKAPSAPAPRAPRAPRGANQAAILRAIRNGATSPAEIAERTGLAGPAVGAAVTTYLKTSKLVVEGPNGLTLTRAGRDKLAELETPK
jgi:hypothetical protein